jgi:hypothetical protein
MNIRHDVLGHSTLATNDRYVRDVALATHRTMRLRERALGLHDSL